MTIESHAEYVASKEDAECLRKTLEVLPSVWRRRGYTDKQIGILLESRTARLKELDAALAQYESRPPEEESYELSCQTD